MRVSQLRVLQRTYVPCGAVSETTHGFSESRACSDSSDCEASKREKNSACKFAQSEPLVYSGTPLLTEVHCNTVGIGDSKVDVVLSSSGTTRASEDRRFAQVRQTSVTQA
jgi:hypothetical protein